MSKKMTARVFSKPPPLCHSAYSTSLNSLPHPPADDDDDDEAFDGAYAFMRVRLTRDGSVSRADNMLISTGRRVF